MRIGVILGLLLPLLGLGLMSSVSPLQAAFRVYELRITQYRPDGKIKRKRRILSSLDANQYAQYHQFDQTDRVEYVDSWYCPGDTSRHRYCRKPKVRTGDERIPASEPGRRTQLPYNRQPVIP